MQLATKRAYVFKHPWERARTYQPGIHNRAAIVALLEQFCASFSSRGENGRHVTTIGLKPTQEILEGRQLELISVWGEPSGSKIRKSHSEGTGGMS